MASTDYNYILSGANDTANRLVVFVNGSTRTADNGVSNVTIRNDAGSLILGNASYPTIVYGKVGIGTASPEYPVTLNTPGSNYGFTHTNETIRVGTYVGGSGGGGWIGTISNHNFYLYTNDSGPQLTVQAGTGNVGIGTTSPSQLLHVYGGQALIDNGTSNTAVQVDRLVFKGSSYFYVLNGSSIGVVLVSGATAWAAQSDARLKNIIEPISNALAKVETLNPVLYSWKSDETNEAHPGLIAQDVLKVQPEAVSEGVDGMMSVRYTELSPLAFAAIKELSVENTALKSRLDSLEARLAAAGL